MKKTLKRLFAAALALLALLSAGLRAGAAYRPIIDAGHGGEDGGAARGDVIEKHINLEIAERLRDVFHLYGIRPVMLRETDISLHSPGAQTLREKKVSDLKHRVERSNAVEDGFLLSIHQNTFTSARYRGSHVFYTAHAESRRFAELLQNAIREHIDETNGREAAGAAKTIYLMQRVECPAVLIECGFLSNSEDVALLRSPAYQTKLSVVIAAAFLTFESAGEGARTGAISLSPR
ncbi:N-acetylmuramoyl-L-alanine amidase [Oscillospiraceae bacterium OttesenSCG-928-G22]|nr:N-acetylmuramoyl-L-alanine amidase [Oscillospiraceae bacterium OttesenSCG-928-G22]